MIYRRSWPLMRDGWPGTMVPGQPSLTCLGSVDHSPPRAFATISSEMFFGVSA